MSESVELMLSWSSFPTEEFTESVLKCLPPLPWVSFLLLFVRFYLASINRTSAMVL